MVATARRFFLSGGAKPFNPEWEDVDRIADYVTALESTLVPEKDFNTRRISGRAAALLVEQGSNQRELVSRFIKEIYDIRSRIVHGSKITQDHRVWLSKNWKQIEDRMRQILVEAVQRLPSNDKERRLVLSGLYDLTDVDRADSVLEKFKAIKSNDVRKTIIDRLNHLKEQRRS